MESPPYPIYFWQTDLVREERRRREVYFKNGQYHDEILFSLTFDEFKRLGR